MSLGPEWRAVAGGAGRDKLIRSGAQVLCVSMSATHVHVLAKMPPGPIPKTWLGVAKKHAAFIAKDHGWAGELWAVGSKITPVKDRRHQLNVFRYILDHAAEGAWVWDFRQEKPREGDAPATPPESPGTAVPGLSS